MTMSSAVPICTIRPARMMAILSPMRTALSRSWMMNTVVLFIIEASSRNSFCSWRRIRGSRALNGSSMSSISESAAIARARPTRCCMPPRVRGELVAPSGQFDHGQDTLRRFQAAVLGDAPDLEGSRNIVEDRAMGHQGEVLKYHRDVFVAIAAQRVAGEGQDVLTAHPNAPVRRFEQAIDVADQGRLAASGQPHDAEDLTPAHFEADVGDPMTQLYSSSASSLEMSLARISSNVSSAISEDLPHASNLDRGFRRHGTSPGSLCSEGAGRRRHVSAANRVHAR